MIFNIGNLKKVKDGCKQFFKCRYQNCDVKCFIQCDKKDKTVSIHNSNNDHMHDSEENKEKQVKGIPKKIKLQIISYYQKKIKKPNIIKNYLSKDFPDEVPSNRQIKDFLYYYRIKNTGNYLIK